MAKNSRSKYEKPDRKLPKAKVAGLVIAGLVCGFFGIVMIVDPQPYVSMGGVGAYARTPVTTFYDGNESRFIGGLILFMATFILFIAYRVKKN